MDDVVAKRPDGRCRLEVVLVLGHDLDDRGDQVAGAVPRGLGRREEARSWEAGLGGRGSDGTQYRKRGKHNTVSERVPDHWSSHRVTITLGHIARARTAGPSLLRVAGAANRRLVAPSSAAPPLRVSVSRGEAPRFRPALCRHISDSAR